MKKLHLLWCLCLALLSIQAAAADKPRLTTYGYEGQTLSAMSDNGKWALLFVNDENEEPAKKVNLLTRQVTALQTETEMAQQGRGVVADITDDGNIIVGAIKGYPAFYNCETKTWTKLPSNGLAGVCHAVTPDGHYAVGKVDDREDGEDEKAWYTMEKPMMWDLTTGEAVDIPASLIPEKDPKGDKISYFRLLAVSPDGRYLMARTLTYAEYFTVLIDRVGNSFSFIGYQQSPNGGSYLPTLPNLYFIEPGAMSPNGKWIVCNGYFVEAQGNGYTNEYSAPVRYNIETGEIEAYNQNTDDQEVYSACIDNNGNVFAGTPGNSPIREFYVRNGKYWYSLRSVLQRKYGIDFLYQTAYDNTGTPMGVSADGNTFISMVDPQFGQNYCLQMDESLVDVCNGMNLLGMYFISPSAGSVMAKMSAFRITFDREVEVVGEQNAARFGSWSSATDNGIVVDPTDSRTVIVTFRTRTLTEGEQYTLQIPAGTICIKGDQTKTNDEITATYTGRANTPVAPSTIYPADNSTLAKLDNSSSPVILQYPYIVNVSENAAAALFTEEGNKVCNLMVTGTGNTVYVTPSNTQYLYADVNYKVIVAEGSITDVSGNGGNDELTIHYSGSYEREVSHDDTVLFKDDFSSPASSVATWLLYDNDHNTPIEAMAAMEYDADNTPWNFSILENTESTDFCAGSHSMYDPAGQSDDWMVTPQLYIPDNLCTLTFDAQSYKKAKKDALKVKVWVCDEPFKYITQETFARMEAEAVDVLDVTLSPGRSEEDLKGDWQSFRIDLSEYEGKYVYIAFVNQNDNQSMVFVDNVAVNRNMKYLLTLRNKQSVVNETGVTIAGTITGNTEDVAYSSLSLTLCDAQGNEIDKINETGLSLSMGKSYSFSFANQLPLTVGLRNNFSIVVELDDLKESINSYVKDLVFQPTKRVVLEEMTGTTCGNCPQGIIAIERMKALYGEQFIPISIHTYDGDALGTGMSAYSGQLGLIAAPTAIVNRNSDIVMPMIQDPETFELTLSYYGYLWMDVVAEEFNRDAEVDIKAQVVLDAEDGTFSVPVSVTSALDAKNVNYNIFLVLMEDNIIGNQLNYYAGETDAVLGDWGQGGRYGKPTVTGVRHDDVARIYYGPNIYGTSGLLPQTMEAGVEYSTSQFQNMTIPGTVENPKNAKMAVILLDANTDKIVNACVAYFDTAAGIDQIVVADTQDGPAYNLQGQKVADGYRGIVVRNGRKHIVR